jgi:hypothetical protein
MRRFSWPIVLSLSLAIVSAVFYLLYWVEVGDPTSTLTYLADDLAFLPIDVLLVTLVIEGLLSRRDKREKLRKLNMVIGAFYSEMGTALLRHLSAHARFQPSLKPDLIVGSNWSPEAFREARRRLKAADHGVDSRKGDLAGTKVFVLSKWPFLLRLLENPNLLQHDAFAELLWAVTHLAEELSSREDLSSLPGPDYDHLSGDIRRAYILLIDGWLAYLEHLKDDYPYLFSLAIRLNPFDPRASVEVA